MKKTALITGASLGIGLELAKVFAKNGLDLVLVARSLDRLKSLKQDLQRDDQNCQVTIIEQDLSIAGSGLQIFNELKSKNIEISYLINNAGFGDYGLFQDQKTDRLLSMIDLNVRSLTELTHLFLPKMMERKFGKIMNVASTAAFFPGPLMAVYYATKHFVLSFSEALAQEVKNDGVTVTALCPGPTQSGFMEAAGMNGSRLVNTFVMPTSQQVAEYGYRAMMNGQSVAVHGLMNRLLILIAKFLPRCWMPTIIHRIQGKM
jgi:short-subunit dehydrogenase